MKRVVSWWGVAILALCVFCCSEDKKKGVGEPCGGNADCQSDICHRGACCPVNPKGNGSTCNVDAECKSYNCEDGTCAAGTRAAGKSCYYNEECASGKCEISGSAPGVCAAVTKQDGGVPDAAVDAVVPDTSLPDKHVPDDAPPAADSKPDVSPDLVAPDLVAPDLVPSPDLASCGNNKKEGTEVCDGTDVGGKKCTDFGFSDGNLDCASDCKSFDTKDCYSFPDTKGIQISTHTNADRWPKTVYDKATGTWLVAWEQSNGDLYTAIVDQSGTVTTPKKILSNVASSGFDVALDGADYVIAYYRWTTLSKGLFMARIDAKTGALKSGTTKQLTFVSYTNPRIARIGNTWLVAWQDGSTKVKAQRVNIGSSGLALMGATIEIAAPTTGSATLQALGTDGTSWLALWTQGSSSDTDIYGRHVHTNGTMTTPVAVAKTAKIFDDHASMVRTVGSTYLVTWVAKTSDTAVPYSCKVMAAEADAQTPNIKVGTPFTVYSKCSKYNGTAVSYDSDNKTYLAIFGWHFSNGDIKAQRFGPDPVTGALRLEDNTPRTISAATGQQQTARVAFGGKYHLIVWTDNRAGTWLLDIYAARFR